MKKVLKQSIHKLVKENGKESLEVHLYPSKCGPSNQVWVKGMIIHVHMIENELYVEGQDEDLKFESVLNEFKYYNCNPDLGKSIHYYIPEKSLQ